MTTLLLQASSFLTDDAAASSAESFLDADRLRASHFNADHRHAQQDLLRPCNGLFTTIPVPEFKATAGIFLANPVGDDTQMLTLPRSQINRKLKSR